MPENIQILTVGRSGAGKTKSILGWKPDDPKPIYVFCLDNRKKLLEVTPNVEYNVFNAIEGFGIIENKLEDFLKIDPVKFPYKAVLFAGITALLDFLILDCANILGGRKGEQTKDYGQRIGKLYIPGMRDYLYVSEAIRQIFYNGLFLLPCDLFVEANIVNAYNSKGEVSGERILATDKVAEKLPTLFDEIWGFTKTESSRVGSQCTFKVKFNGSLERTSIQALERTGIIDITNKNLYKEIKNV